jgi:hypothetical protein
VDDPGDRVLVQDPFDVLHFSDVDDLADQPLVVLVVEDQREPWRAGGDVRRDDDCSRGQQLA